MKAPQITLYPGYNPHSPTLRGPFWCTGIVRERVSAIDSHKVRINDAAPACMGESLPPGTQQYFDLGITPKHGDIVMVWTAREQFCKRWLVVNGEPFLACHWYTIPLAWIPDVRAIAVCVAEVSYPGAYFSHIRHQVMATDEDDAQWRRELNARPKVHRAIGKFLSTFKEA